MEAKKGISPYIHYENLTEFQEVKLTDVWRTPDDWVPQQFLSLKLGTPLLQQFNFSSLSPILAQVLTEISVHAVSVMQFCSGKL